MKITHDRVKIITLFICKPPHVQSKLRVMPNEFGYEYIHYFSLQLFEIIKADIEIKVLWGVISIQCINFNYTIHDHNTDLCFASEFSYTEIYLFKNFCRVYNQSTLEL